jgi:hypothetical protein
MEVSIVTPIFSTGLFCLACSLVMVEVSIWIGEADPRSVVRGNQE